MSPYAQSEVVLGCHVLPLPSAPFPLSPGKPYFPPSSKPLGHLSIELPGSLRASLFQQGSYLSSLTVNVAPEVRRCSWKRSQ